MGLCDTIHVATFLKILSHLFTPISAAYSIFSLLLFLGGLFVIHWKYGVYVVLAECHQGSLKLLLTYIMSINYINCSLSTKGMRANCMYLCVYFYVFLCALFLSYSKRISKAVSGLHQSYLGLFYFPY